eukprot:Pgem_evm2s1086
MKLFSIISCYLIHSIAGAATTGSTDFRIGLRTLILSNDVELDKLPTGMIEAFGANYDLVRVVDDNNKRKEVDTLNLYDGTNPRYNSIVMLSSTLSVYNDATKDYPPGLSTALFAELDDYKQKYGVRSVVLQSNSNVDESLSPASTPSGQFANVRFTKDGYVNDFNSNVVNTTTFKLGNEYKEMSPAINFYQYPVTINSTLNADNHIKAFMELKAQNQTDIDENWEIAAFTRTVFKNGTYPFDMEEMHFLFTANYNTHHGLVLSNIWFTWVTKGIFLGQRRVLLNTHIDDFFLSTDLYNEFYTPGNTYRNSATDIEMLVHYQNNRRATMPEGSTYTIEFAFNGFGYEYGAGVIDDGSKEKLNDVIISLRDNFHWTSHTWSHMDLYCVESNCTTPATEPVLKCYDWDVENCTYPNRTESDNLEEPVYPVSGYSPYDYIVYELTRNKNLAKYTLFEGISDADLENHSNWSPHSMVTPRISGMNYTVAIRAMLEAGIYSAVGDNSRADLAPDNIFHGFQSRPLVQAGGVPFNGSFTPVDGRTGLFVMPRFSTRIYYDTSTPEESVGELNTFYGPRCLGWNQTGPLSWGGPPEDSDGGPADLSKLGLKCNTTTFKYEEDLTFAEMLEIESYENARNLLQYRMESYMFHQANLRFFPVNTTNGTEKGNQTLLTMWVDAVAGHLLRYNTFPVLSFKLDDLAKFYKARMDVDACDVSGYVEYIGGKPVFIDLESSQSEMCDGRLTVTKTQGNEEMMKFGKDSDKNQAAYKSSERYGVDSTYYYSLSKSDSIKEAVDPATAPIVSTTSASTTTTSTSSTSSTDPGSASSIYLNLGLIITSIFARCL